MPWTAWKITRNKRKPIKTPLSISQIVFIIHYPVIFPWQRWNDENEQKNLRINKAEKVAIAFLYVPHSLLFFRAIFVCFCVFLMNYFLSFVRHSLSAHNSRMLELFKLIPNRRHRVILVSSSIFYYFLFLSLFSAMYATQTHIQLFIHGFL